MLTSIAALVAAGGEVWRYLLLLRGRTELLSGPVVAGSDRLVTISAWFAVMLALITAVIAVPMLVRLHALAADRVGLAPSRTPAGVLARLVVPGWNIYGLGVVSFEIDGLLGAPGIGRRPLPSRLVLAWWCSWAVNALLVLLTLVWAFGSSEQRMADTVELHILVDLTGAVVALLAALVLARFRRLLRGGDVGGRDDRWSGWVVRQPERTRGVLQPSTPS